MDMDPSAAMALSVEIDETDIAFGDRICGALGSRYVFSSWRISNCTRRSLVYQ